MARVSVIITTHNRATLLPRAVASAFAASSDVEVIVVDDASTDHTPQVCQHLEGIRYFRMERNGGFAHARNVGFTHSTGDYVCFLDDDDVRLPGTLDLQVQVLEHQPTAGWVMGQMYSGKDDTPVGEPWPKTQPTGDAFWPVLYEEFFVQFGAVLLRRSCLEQVGLFDLDPALYHSGDLDLSLRLSECFPLAELAQPVLIYNIYWFTGPDKPLSANHLGQILCHRYACARAFRLARLQALPEPARRQVAQRLHNYVSDRLIYEAAKLLPHGWGAQARALLLTALRLYPWRAARPWTFQLLWQSFWTPREKTTTR